VKIGKYEIKHPNYSRWNGCRNKLGSISRKCKFRRWLGVISAVGTGYYKNKSENIHIITKKDKPKDVANFYSRDSLFEIVANARKICGDAPIGCNVLYAINDYGRVVRDACEAGVNMIITGAGFLQICLNLQKIFQMLH
jgi:nitronate monooxygenase